MSMTRYADEWIRCEAESPQIDYDDAFVAYLNDVEIARAGISGNPPAHNQPADIQHEAEMQLGGLPSTFAIDNQILLSSLTQNENVLAIQVHNASETSSDMSSTTFLSLGISDTTHSVAKPRIPVIAAGIVNGLIGDAKAKIFAAIITDEIITILSNAYKTLFLFDSFPEGFSLSCTFV